MSISTLDNPSDELVEALVDGRRKVNKIMRSIKGSSDYKCGYRAYLEGFELTDHDRAAYTTYQGDYSKGYDDAKMKFPDREIIFKD